MEPTDTTAFGSLLRTYRVGKALSQEELAERAGLSVRGISDLERGVRRTPQRATVQLLAEALELSNRERGELEAAVTRSRSLSPDTRPGLASPAGAAGATPSTLPVPATPLVGRKREVGDVKELLGRNGVRLVTLTGPGGVGKTHLVLDVARGMAGAFLDGEHFVGLAPIVDPPLVPTTIAQALGAPEAGWCSPVVSLKEYLRDRHLLLVLDNFEQLLGAAPLVSELLASSPGLKVLATSRQRYPGSGPVQLQMRRPISGRHLCSDLIRRSQ